jgi:dTDP-4-dehydrorhamnose reductase
LIRVLVLGAKGQLGSEMCRWLAGSVELVAADRQQADLSDPAATAGFVADVRPHVLVNAAAYTAVDRAESEASVAFRINAEAPGVLAEQCRRIGAKLVHFSTDYVFDGESARPYQETDPCRPLNEYGRTKLAGEIAIAQTGADHLIARVAWLYGLDGGNFVKTMLRLARERSSLSVVDDQFGAPTWVRTIAQWLRTLLTPQGGQETALQRAEPGVYHLAPTGRTTWFEVARTAISIADSHALTRDSMRCRAADVLAIRSTQYPTPARRPANSQLDSTKAVSQLAWPAPDWRDELVAFTRLLLDEQARDAR